MTPRNSRGRRHVRGRHTEPDPKQVAAQLAFYADAAGVHPVPGMKCPACDGGITSFLCRRCNPPKGAA